MLEDLRKKPKTIRNLYAFWAALGLTGVIGLFWLVSLVTQLDDTTKQVEESTGEAKGAFALFFSQAKNNLANVFSMTEDPAKSDTLPETTTPSLQFNSAGLNFTTTTTPVRENEIESSKERPLGRPILIETTTTKGVSTTPQM